VVIFLLNLVKRALQEWLDDYPYHNVMAFDFYDVLTTNGGDHKTNAYG
jgi:hypothetical protein